jgi:hypothetical protein
VRLSDLLKTTKSRHIFPEDIHLPFEILNYQNNLSQYIRRLEPILNHPQDMLKFGLSLSLNLLLRPHPTYSVSAC